MVKTLYSIIGELGKDKIQRDITLNIEKSRQYIEIILTRCCKISDFTTTEIIGSLCEALLHFMLTASTIPSVRKVSIDDIKLDIVIPNIHTLRNFPDKAIVIRIIKEGGSISKEEQQKIRNIQPNHDNLWVVSKEPFLGNYINYTVNFGNNMNASMRRSFHDIIVDIDSFLERTRDRSFRFFH
ncbi:MAG TPA: hypothetical protein VK566_08305 [Nitrososphaeraceae archaeon]|jgi:hypothetical protein|nr:hypothetical protein [Nitrososphaeraceae archaeon]